MPTETRQVPDFVSCPTTYSHEQTHKVPTFWGTIQPYTTQGLHPAITGITSSLLARLITSHFLSKGKGKGLLAPCPLAQTRQVATPLPRVLLGHLSGFTVLYTHQRVHTHVVPLAAGHHKEYEEYTVSEFTILAPIVHCTLQSQ